jgi:dTDP-4-amino-4,6-dideoxygalactose transaminase
MTPPRIPFTRLAPAEDAEAIAEAIRRVVASGWYILGPEVDAFEQAFAEAAGVGHAVGVGTGTDALALILRGLGIGPGDEVITSPLSAAYTALAIMMAGAQPVFADIDPVRLTLDPEAAASAITSRTRAILPVHLYGQAAAMPALRRVADRHGLALVEDCCQAHLGTCEGVPLGTWGAGGAFSFYPTKNLGALGDAGMVVTNDAGLAGRVRRLRNGGQSDRYHHVEAGVNTRLDELQAAVLRARLPRLPDWTGRRRALAGSYRAALDGLPVVVPRECDSGHVYHLFVVLSSNRDALRGHLASQGIETLVHYPVPISRQQAFASLAPATCPVADRTCDQVVSLPLYPGLEREAIGAVVSGIASFAGKTCVR